MRSFLDELREHWDDGYWWADRQILLAIILGLVGLGFFTLRLLIARALTVTPEPAA